MVAANSVLFKTASELTQSTGEIHKKGEHPDHIVVIKHVPAVGDSKRAIDEYYSELLMGGRNVMVSYGCRLKTSELNSSRTSSTNVKTRSLPLRSSLTWPSSPNS